jgi:hypothetical protein
LECGGSAAAFPKPPALQKFPARSAGKNSAPAPGRHSERSEDLIQYSLASPIASKVSSSFDRSAAAWIRFFVAKCAPQNDGKFLAAC